MTDPRLLSCLRNIETATQQQATVARLPLLHQAMGREGLSDEQRDRLGRQIRTLEGSIGIPAPEVSE